MKGRREKWALVAAAALFGVVFGILSLACGQSEDQPEMRTDGPASAKARPDMPPAPAASKVAETATSRDFGDFHSHLRDLGAQLEALRPKAEGELGVALANLEVEQARLMAELDAIGGDGESWDAARAKLVPQIIGLRGQIRALREKLNE
ncbi:MAG: hypothetical protein JRF15_12820 [Deltaproteobacteria bacterium]|jgi:hypothetical protein|nr:hypothetical protein [Deltaproteobacteria bacterium]